MTATHLGHFPTHSEQWHAARADRIGGSDIGVICGWSDFKTRDQLLTEKAGRVVDGNDTKARERGRYCEPAVLTWLATSEGFCYDPGLDGTWVDGWKLFNPDAITDTGILVEAKTCGVRDVLHGWGRAGTAEVPLCYAAQVHWGLGLLGLEHAVLGVLSGAPRFEFARYRIRFDPTVYAYLVAQAEQFRADLHIEESA